MYSWQHRLLQGQRGRWLCLPPIPWKGWGRNESMQGQLLQLWHWIIPSLSQGIDNQVKLSLTCLISILLELVWPTLMLVHQRNKISLMEANKVNFFLFFFSSTWNCSTWWCLISILSSTVNELGSLLCCYSYRKQSYFYKETIETSAVYSGFWLLLGVAHSLNI